MYIPVCMYFCRFGLCMGVQLWNYVLRLNACRYMFVCILRIYILVHRCVAMYVCIIYYVCVYVYMFGYLV